MSTAFLDAEEDVLGCVLLAASYAVEAGHKILDRAVATGLGPEHFWRASNASLFALLGSMRQRGMPLDALALAVELEGVDAPAHERGRLEVLARQIPAWGIVEHRAGIVMAAARQRADEEGRWWT